MPLEDDEEENEKLNTEQEYVLGQDVVVLPWTELSIVFDEFGISDDVIAIEILRRFDFTSQTDILIAKFGSCHDRFLEHLISKNIAIKDVYDACQHLDFSGHAIDDLYDMAFIKNEEYFDTLTRNKMPSFYKSLVENKDVPVQKCWRQIAERLGLQEFSNYMTSAYQKKESSPSMNIFRILQQHNIKVKELKEKINELEGNEKAKDHFKIVLEKRIEQERLNKQGRSHHTDQTVIDQSGEDLDIRFEFCISDRSEVDGQVILPNTDPSEKRSTPSMVGEVTNMGTSTFPDVIDGCKEVIQGANLKNNTDESTSPPVQNLDKHQGQSKECQQILLKNLKMDHIHQLKKYLDPITYQMNWRNLGKVIFHGDAVMTAKVEKLDLNYAGGGSPAKEFIKYFKMNFDYTIKDFMDIATKCSRKDIQVRLFEKYGSTSHSKFNDIEPLLEIEICDLLDISGRGFGNWKEFAMMVGCDDTELIDSFQTAVVTKQQDSPTEGLLTLIKENKPEYTLHNLSEDLYKLRRNDVKQYIDELSKLLLQNHCRLAHCGK